MNKKFLTVLCCIAMVCAFSACSGNENSSQPDPQPSEEAETETESSESELTAPVQENSDTVYKGDCWSVTYNTGVFAESIGDEGFCLTFKGSKEGIDTLTFRTAEEATAEEAMDKIAGNYAEGALSEITRTTVGTYKAVSCKTNAQEGSSSYTVFTAVENNSKVVIIEQFLTPEQDVGLTADIIASFDEAIAAFTFDIQ